MQIYFVRHTDFYNPENIYPFHLPLKLSDAGVAHAKRIGEWFKKNKIINIQIYSSPINRCKQTAEILSSYINSQIDVDARLIETSCPNLQGKIRPEKDSWLLEEEDPTREPRESILERMLNFYNEKINAGKNCVAVSHGDEITILYYYLNNIEVPKHLWSPDNAANIIDKGEIVKLELEGADLKNISRINV